MRVLKYLLLSTSLMLTMNAVTQAEVIDMSKFTCKQLLSGTQDAVEAAIWTSGYYHGLHKSTKLDLVALKQNGDAVIAACKDNPNKSVMQTVTTLSRGAKK
jgi:hypothetical protein